MCTEKKLVRWSLAVTTNIVIKNFFNISIAQGITWFLSYFIIFQNDQRLAKKNKSQRTSRAKKYILLPRVLNEDMKSWYFEVSLSFAIDFTEITISLAEFPALTKEFLLKEGLVVYSDAVVLIIVMSICESKQEEVG